MGSMKPEPLEYPTEIRSGSIEPLRDIKSDTMGRPLDVKSETIEYTPEVPRTKRLKTLRSVSPWGSSGGISKVEKEDDDDSLSEKQLDACGVCLSEEGMSLRGFIDSCGHYFCFVCIMEWAKVESRCPICKRRFSTIRRPPKDGVFLSERIVDVPVRDQVYYYNGNATCGPSDPYSQVKCSVCNLGTDDGLLLLCDLCDSAAHSYCVGLGATVPEGDWFCLDCTLSRDEHARVERDANSNGDTCSSGSNTVQFTRSRVSINDIVRESSIDEPDTSSVAASSMPNESTAQCSGTQPTVGRTSNASNARTLQRCLIVHARIKVLRENWDGFRGGSLSFSSNYGNDNQRQSSSLNQESTSQKDPYGHASPDRGSYNVDRAWKMMDIAVKALGRKCAKKISVERDSKHHVRRERLLKNANEAAPNGKYSGGLRNRSVGVVKSIQNNVECELPSSREVIMPVQVDNCRYNGQNLSRKDCLGPASDVVGSSGGSSRLVRPPSIATDEHRAKKGIDATFKEKGGTKQVEDAKSEIQSLVKLNLKLLTRGKKLGMTMLHGSKCLYTD